MKKKLILLIGFHKTGTTSIQTACGDNLELLAAAGFLFPFMWMKNSDGSVYRQMNHSALLTPIFKGKAVPSFYKNPHPEEIRSYEVARKQRRDALKNYLELNQGNLLLVAEECSLLAPVELLDLRDFFQALNFEIQVYCCIRSPSPWLNSMVTQQVMGQRALRLNIARLIQNFVASDAVIVPRIQKVIAAFPDTRFYSFAAAAAHNAGPAGYFLSQLGIDLGEGFRSIRDNVGGSDHAVRLNNKINETLGSRFEIPDNDRLYNELLSRHPALFEIPGNKFALREGEVTSLLPCLIKENEWLKNTFGAGFYDEHSVFSNDPVLLDNETRQFLIDNFESAEQPVKKIVEAYLAEHQDDFIAGPSRARRLLS